MIKVAILGADTPKAGELSRLLFNHPEVEITALVAPGQEGKPISSVHHGFHGEEAMNFTSILPAPKEVDVLFVATGTFPAEGVISLKNAKPELITVFMEPVPGFFGYDETPVYGLPEINRKPLVRGAKTAVIPSPAASATLVALYPLALNMILNPSLKIDFTLPSDLVKTEKTRAEKEIGEMLGSVQKSFEDKIDAGIETSATPRSMEIDISLECSINLEHILGLYEMYDDHRFAFQVNGRISASDVAGTQKCLFNISKPSDDILRIHVIADPRMRGGAGEAVHVMNLLCGLHEKTGLSLKSNDYFQS